MDNFNTSKRTEDFPKIALCPKKETGVVNFLAKYPNFDGKGVVIAILDSGVDPAVDGLRVTTDGRPKVIERYDCSGAGDVDTSTIVKKSEKGTIQAISGRILKVPDSWENPTGDYHIGVKPVFELYTAKVKERIEAKRKEENWDSIQRVIASEASRKLNKEQVIYSGKSNDTLTPLEKLAKEETEAQVEILSSIDKKYKDLGPMFDCVVWHNGTEWQVCLSYSEDLEKGIILGEYKLRQEYASLTKDDQVTISVNIWDEGNRLEIVGMSGSHGTHVSCIAAGCFPDDPLRNGVSPGSQIISFSIGDNRLGSMETATAITRAMMFIMQNSDRIHIINMSYGEHSNYVANGRLGQIMEEVVHKYGVIWVASAGNAGPALSTIGSPPWINNSPIIGCGAYVSSEMMAAEYSLREMLPGQSYTWTSRGPSLDGDLGVTVSAPGAAITSVPFYTLRSSQLMNGTSMAAPNLTGCIALMFSGALEKGFTWTPYSLKHAIKVSALALNPLEPFAQGEGLVQVEGAFKVLEKMSSLPEKDVRFNISVSASGMVFGWPMKGIYIRDPQIEKAKEFNITVEPMFFKDSLIDPEKKINFHMNLCLLCDKNFVTCPKFFDLANMARSFNVKVNPEGLNPGVHFAKVCAYDVNDMDKGPIFSVPVTIVKPMKVNMSYRPSVEFPDVHYEPGLIKRYYISVPKGTTWATLNLKLHSTSQNNDSSGTNSVAPARFIIHTLTVLPGQSCKNGEFYKMINLNHQEESNLQFKVYEGRILEVVISRWWAEPNEIATLSSTITFRSLYINRPEIVMCPGDVYQKVVVSTAYSTEEIQPSASLKHQVLLLRPTEMKINSLTQPRDALPVGRISYELQATYNFSLSRPTELTVNSALTSETLYEGEYESQLWMIFDNNKKYIASGDAYPANWVAKLEKGDFVLKLHIRHEKREALEKFFSTNSNGGGNGLTYSGDQQVPNLPVLLSMKLPSSISLDVYQTQHDNQDYKPNKKSNWTVILKKEASTNIFISSSISDKNLKSLPSSSSTSYLQGTFSVTKDENAKKFLTYPLKVCLPEPHKFKSSSSSKDSEKNKVDDMKEQIRDLKINWISKLDYEESTKLYEELKNEFPDHIQLHIARIQYLDSLPVKSNDVDKEGNVSSEADSKKPNKTVDTYNEIISISDKIFSLVDRSALLVFYGTKSSSNNLQQDASKTKQTMDKQKAGIIEAFAKKGNALIEILRLNNISKEKAADSSSEKLSEIDEIFLEVQKFADLHDSKVIEFAIQHAIHHQQYGRALKLYSKQMETDPKFNTLESDKKVQEIFKLLNWTHCEWLFKETCMVKFPKEYRLF